MKTEPIDPAFFNDDENADCTFRVCGAHHCVYMTLKGRCYRFAPQDFFEFASTALQVLQRLSSLGEEARPAYLAAWQNTVLASS